jgi:hypothetical protein
MEAVFAERAALEPTLIDIFPTCLPDGRITGDEEAMRYGGWK